MNKALTDKEAEEQFKCDDCKEWPKAYDRINALIHSTSSVESARNLRKDLDLVAHNACGGECVVGKTLSRRCSKCEERIWFQSKGKIPLTFDCPYCGNKEDNTHHATRHNDFEDQMG